MNRFKKYIQKSGFRLEQDCDQLPLQVANNIYLDAIIVNSEKATIKYIYNCDDITLKLQRDGCFIPE